MQSLQVEGQTDQAPFAGRRQLATQRELAGAQHLLDDPDHWLDRRLPRRIDRLAEAAVAGEWEGVVEVVGRRSEESEDEVQEAER